MCFKVAVSVELCTSDVPFVYLTFLQTLILFRYHQVVSLKIFQNTVTFVALLIPLLNIGELILVFVILCSCKNVYLLLYGFVTLALFLVKQKQSIDPVFGNIFAMVFIQFDTLYLINFWKHYYGLDRQTQQIKDNPRRLLENCLNTLMPVVISDTI